MSLLLALVVSIALVDSLNPSTVGPALLYAIGSNPKRDVAAFALGVFVTSTVGGVVLVVGPGRALLSLASRPSPHTVHLIEVGSGALLLLCAAALWLLRGRIDRQTASKWERRRPSAFAVGAGIILVEYPTAIPYFGALAAIVELRRNVGFELLFVLVYNLCFVVPILVVFGAVSAGGKRGAVLTRRARDIAEGYARVVIPIALGLLGAAILFLGVAGLHG